MSNKISTSRTIRELAPVELDQVSGGRAIKVKLGGGVKLPVKLPHLPKKIVIKL